MKKILTVGQNSYVGRHLKNHLLNKGGGFVVHGVSSRTPEWNTLNFGMYDYIIDLAAIAHISEKDCPEEAFYKINRDLTFALAEKAKADGVKAFIYMSTMEVYGATHKVGKTFIIDKNTPLHPNTLYGKSKLAGEEKIKALEDDTFKIIILRAPMIYGVDCPGKYAELETILEQRKKIPKISNEISAIHISTLCAFIQYLMDHDLSGTFHPQNKEYLSTLALMDTIAKEKNFQIKISKFQGFWMQLFKGSIPDDIQSAFASVVYAKDIDL